ncbi:vacuolar protein sorting protein VPS11 [Rhizophagus irregularis]|uniref:E3 ubiquitin-protein ligase PEP5 n=1 Tax=Rhizophagus irregularis TaxID=588596 RepID=A0A2I1EIT8_9GLOM|nr:vacuolar protein sorting protein VPS11 [Rhizophagus irregularis]PKY22024.1 vacuolar protein sorting protein VPS11 [Rhizophagus irregularis]
MSVKQWRHFTFFDVQQIKDHDSTKPPAIFQKTDITVTYEGGRVTHMKQIKQKNILLTVGEEDFPIFPIIKIWDLDKQDKSKGIPICLRTIKVNHGGKPFPVSTIAVLDNLSQIAVGLANGVVVLIRGDLKERHTKQKVIHESDEPVTGLGFKENNKNTILFIVTINKVLTCITPIKSQPIIIDEQGCALGCAVISDITHEMVVAKDEGIYFYGTEGRGACFAYEGTKSEVIWFKSNLIIVSPPAQSTRYTSTTHTGSSNQKNTSPFELTKVTIFDTANKFIAYVGTFSHGIRTICCEWGGIYILGMDGKLYRLEEKDTPTKLEILFKKNLYLLAINLAHSQKYDDASISEIFKKYGDHLYSKADYDSAMAQYIRTIGQLEPSYIIRKFLDAQRIHNLVNYLQELHSHDLATPDHTTLLLNCYTKLKDVARLDQFIKTDNKLNFDLETAIKVCRQAGYYEHAVYLAKLGEEHDLYLKIQIEDTKDYQNALEYIRNLGSLEANRNLQKYGKILLNHLPEPTTKLLIDLCTGDLYLTAQNPHTPEPVGPTEVSHPGGIPYPSFLQFAHASPAPSLNAETQANITAVNTPKEPKTVAYKPPPVRTFMSLFVDQPNYLIQFLEKVSQKRWGGFGSIKPSQPAHNLSLAKGQYVPIDNIADEAAESSKSFFESDAEIEEKKAVWNTLLELYLSEAYLPPVISTKDAKGRKNGAPGIFGVTTETERVKEKLIRKDKALQLLMDEDISYDANQALVLCYLAQFDEGIIYLYEKMKMYEDILRFYMAKDNTEKVIQALKKYGPQDQSLYPLTLTYFSSSPATLATSTTELLKILDHIESHNLLPPLQVVQALSRNSVATLGMVKGYLGKRIELEKKEAQADMKLIQSYREETEKKRKEIDDLKTTARIFQVTKCTGCRSNLDLPAVHFLCRHSFHQRCLPDSDRECPQCAVQHRMISEIRRAQEENAEKHELFFEQLKEAEDGFSVIADYFSKNTMAFAKLID